MSEQAVDSSYRVTADELRQFIERFETVEANGNVFETKDIPVFGIGDTFAGRVFNQKVEDAVTIHESERWRFGRVLGCV